MKGGVYSFFPDNPSPRVTQNLTIFDREEKLNYAGQLYAIYETGLGCKCRYLICFAHRSDRDVFWTVPLICSLRPACISDLVSIAKGVQELERMFLGIESRQMQERMRLTQRETGEPPTVPCVDFAARWCH